MSYKFLKEDQEDSFYPVTEREILKVEKELNLKFPEELVGFYAKVGYGFIQGSEYNINRIMDPYSVRDFRLRKNDFKDYPDIEIYEKFEIDKLIFFEGSESALISIALNEKNRNPVYYYDIEIATSLDECLREIKRNDEYYLEYLID